MEESRALSKLNEATDLLILLEDVLNPAAIERLSQASWSGLRLTLRNARTTLQESQVSLTKEFVARARSGQVLNGTSVASVSTENRASNIESQTLNATATVEGASSGSIVNAGISNFDKNIAEQNRVQITRRDLKATLEKFIETR